VSAITIIKKKDFPENRQWQIVLITFALTVLSERAIGWRFRFCCKSLFNFAASTKIWERCRLHVWRLRYLW